LTQNRSVGAYEQGGWLSAVFKFLPYVFIFHFNHIDKTSLIGYVVSAISL